MSEQHSKGTWQRLGMRIFRHWYDDHEVTLGVMSVPDWHEDYGKGLEEAEANAARVVACVNELAGVPTAALESGAVARLAKACYGLMVRMDHNELLRGEYVNPSDTAAANEANAALAPFNKEPPDA